MVGEAGGNFSLLQRSRVDRVADASTGSRLGGMDGFSLGLGFHLLEDTFQTKAVMFPVINSLVDGTSLDDRLCRHCSALNRRPTESIYVSDFGCLACRFFSALSFCAFFCF
jgi:hypothetical protein